MIEADSMSVTYINPLKDSKGVFIVWAEIIANISLTVTHMVVTSEDCVSREPQHLPELTEAELALENNYEDDPLNHLDVTKLVETQG